MTVGKYLTVSSCYYLSHS